LTPLHETHTPVSAVRSFSLSRRRWPTRRLSSSRLAQVRRARVPLRT
jgi:hypothetical protein